MSPTAVGGEPSLVGGAATGGGAADTPPPFRLAQEVPTSPEEGAAAAATQRTAVTAFASNRNVGRSNSQQLHLNCYNL